MSRVTLEQWRMLRTVVECGGFNQAAKVVHKSPSSIHHAIQKLETLLGVRLLAVEGRKMVLTDTGEVLLRRATHVLDEAEKLEALSTTLGSSSNSLLRIAVDQVFPRKALNQVLSSVSCLFPQANIELIESTLSGTSDLLRRGEVDIAVGAFPSNDRYCEELCKVDFVAVASPEHALHSDKQILTLEELRDHRQIVVRDSNLDEEQDHGWLGANQRWTVSNVSTSIELVTNGFGFAWLPCWEIAESLESGRLKSLPLKYNETKSIQIYLMFNHIDAIKSLAQCVIDELRIASTLA